MKPFKLILSILIVSVTAHAQWQKYDAGTTASFRGLDVVSENVVWASGTGGTVIRTIDGGKNWNVFVVPGADKLDFRDIEAFDAETAYILSIGNGENSRIYKTTDGGKTWELQFKNTDEKAFFDSIAFWDPAHGIAQSDPVDGKYVLMVTSDGESWIPLSTENMPAAKDGEAAFAASGTSIVTRGKKEVFLVSGGSTSRVFYSKNRGKSWVVTDAPINEGTSGAGIFSIALNGKKGVLVGGDYTKPELDHSNIAYSVDGGRKWETRKKSNPFGYRSGVTFIDPKTILIVGSTGSDISYDAGFSWTSVDGGNYNAVQSAGRNAVWAVGPNGMVAKLTALPRP